MAARPHFREVPAWDAHYHVQHLSLPAGASYGDLLRLVADLHEPMLDRDRPLFRCWVIDGVPGGMFALYTKTHHAVIDGASGMKALYAGLSTSDQHTIGKPGFALGAPAATPRPRAPVAKRIADSIRSAVTQVGAIEQVSVGALRKTIAGLVGSHLDGSLPFTAQHAPTNEPLTMGRRFATLSLPLEEMHEVGRHFGATLNDVAVTIVDAGLHAYLRESGRGSGTRSSRCVRCRCAPTATRRSARGCRRCSCDSESPARPRLSGSDQVVDSIATAKKELRGMSNDAAMTYAVGLVALAGLAASTHLDRVGHPACNLVISNVPGAKEPRYLNGARLVDIYPVSALAASIGLNATLTSYHDRMDFGFVASAAAIDDLQELTRHTLWAYKELKDAAAQQPAGRSAV